MSNACLCAAPFAHRVHRIVHRALALGPPMVRQRSWLVRMWLLALLGTIVLGVPTSQGAAQTSIRGLPSALPSVTGAPSAATAAEARAAVMALLKRHEEQWNRHDMEAWAEILHEDVDWVNWRGGYWHGKAATKAGHEEIHRTFYKASRLSAQRVEDLTFLAPDIVLVHARGELSGDERALGVTFRYRKTIIVTKREGAWRIRALHNTRLEGVD